MAISHGATFTITAEQDPRLRQAIERLAAVPTTVWLPAERANGELCGAEVAETPYRFATADLRLVVRHEAKVPAEQLTVDDLGGRRFFAFVPIAGAEHAAVALITPGPRNDHRATRLHHQGLGSSSAGGTWLLFAADASCQRSKSRHTGR